jgi:hypothetical protein
MMSKNLVFGSQRNQQHDVKKLSMKFRVDKILREYIQQVCQPSHLGRTDGRVGRDAVFAKVLAELENSGDAMRYLNSEGQIAWRATPRLQQEVKDLLMDAKAELAEEQD